MNRRRVFPLVLGLLFAIPAGALATEAESEVEIETPITVIEVPIEAPIPVPDRSGNAEDEASSGPPRVETPGVVGQSRDNSSSTEDEQPNSDGGRPESEPINPVADETTIADPPGWSSPFSLLRPIFGVGVGAVLLAAVGAVVAASLRKEKGAHRAPVPAPGHQERVSTRLRSLPEELTPADDATESIANLESSSGGPSPLVDARATAVAHGSLERARPVHRAGARPAGAADRSNPDMTIDLRGRAGTPLTVIYGIGPAIADRLCALGVCTVEELAGLDKAGLDRIHRGLGGNAWRIDRGDWVAIAKQLTDEE